MTALAHAQEGGAEIVAQADGLLSVIERAARDPNVDIDKMEKLLAMSERVHARNAEAAYADALAALQPSLPVISERGKILNRQSTVQSTYARWEDINEAIRPHLAEHGFSLAFRTGRADNGDVVVTGVMKHRAGHKEETTLQLPIDASGSKNAVQAIGSSTSYGKRYTAFALLNITTKGEDDDGVGALPAQAHRDGPDAPAPGKRPLPQGKHTARTHLLNAIRDLKAQGETVSDAGTFEELLEAFGPDLHQLEADRHDWWTSGEYENVPAWIARRRSELGSSFQRLLSGLTACATKAALSFYWDQNEALIDALDDGDRRTFEDAFEARESAVAQGRF